MKTVSKAQSSGTASISSICECVNLTRDAYYKFKRRYEQNQVRDDIVLDLVKGERKDQPRTGTRKVYEAIKPDFHKLDIKVGRDKLFDILRTHDMLIKRKKAYCKTTNSYHRFYKYNNLIKDIEITRPNQVWVADITYVRMVKGFCYLALITDLYSRKIVGYDVSDSLELSGCIRALKMALKTARPADGLIHHSDRGIQYCSNQYTQILIDKNIKISMTEENHCYENAIAERVNGILKDEFYLDQCFFNLKSAEKAAQNAIKIYNSKRLHLSLDYKTPNMVYKMTA
jgi:transposase InsO family protein